MLSVVPPGGLSISPRIRYSVDPVLQLLCLFFSRVICRLNWLFGIGGGFLIAHMYVHVKRLNLNYIQLRLCVSIVTWEVRRRRINNSS